MRLVLLLLMMVVPAQLAAVEILSPALSEFLQRADDFLQTAVEAGGVDYEAIRTRPERLNALLSSMATMDPAELNADAAGKAFWINAYNLCTIASVVASYPLKSPQEKPGFFVNKAHAIVGERWSLNEIEQEKLQKGYHDPRVHFAIVCAARGCPPIIDRAYLPERIDAQLDDRARAVVNDQRWIRLDHETGTVHASKIFDWYRHEFEEQAGSLLKFLNAYRIEAIPEDYSMEFMPYDWQLNEIRRATSTVTVLKDYTPGKLLRPGQVELKEFLNLYTQTSYFDEDSERRDQNSRSTYFTGTTTILYGFASRWNLGLDIVLKSVLNAEDKNSSPFDVLRFSSDGNARTAVTSVAPKAKISPFDWAPTLSLEAAIVIPLADELEKAPFLDYDGVQMWTQLFYDYSLGDDFLIYFESDYYWRPETDVERFATPIKAIAHYYPSDQWVVYTLGEWAPSWDNGTVNAYYTQLGLGVKHQVLSNLELECLASIFPVGKSKGAGTTLNIGVRFLR